MARLGFRRFVLPCLDLVLELCHGHGGCTDLCLGLCCTVLPNLEFCDRAATCQQDLFPEDCLNLSGHFLPLGDVSSKTFRGLFCPVLSLLEDSLT